MDRNLTLRLNDIFSKPRNLLLAAVIIFLPVLFMGGHNSHDWGDDFAQYIHQAGNIVNGIPQSETGFVYSQVNFIGPQTYPAGFPLLLSPVYAVFGNNIVAFIRSISVFYILLGLLLVIFYRQTFSWFSALVLATVYMYNPQMILFKCEIMSDIPFTALLVLSFILYMKSDLRNLKHLLILALVSGFMITIRPTGFIFVFAVVVYQLQMLIKRKLVFKEFAIRSGIFLLIPGLIYLLINVIIFKIPSGGSISNYLAFYQTGKYCEFIPANLQLHIETFRFLYLPQSGPLMGFSLLLASVMLAMALFGFIKRLLKGAEVLDWFFIFYMVMLLLFPDNHSAFRLMVPLGFIYLFYAVTGLKTIQLLIHIPAWKKSLAFGSLIIIMFIPGLSSIVRGQGNIIEGPQQKTAIEALSYIKNNVPAEAVVVFAKPRALALYGGCHSMTDPRTTDPTLFHLQIVNNNASYLLICNQLTAEVMLRYTRVMQNRLTKQFENKDFILYKINSVSR